jgi:hypothetical protein
MSLEIIGAESLGVRSLCCLVTLPHRRIVIDPGISLGYLRYGLLPHPRQIAMGCRIREKILQSLNNATDVVISRSETLSSPQFWPEKPGIALEGGVFWHGLDKLILLNLSSHHLHRHCDEEQYKTGGRCGENS